MMGAPVRFGEMQVFATEADRDRPLTTSNGFQVDQMEPGALSYIEDTGRVEVWNGSEWLNVSTGPNYAILESTDPDPSPGDHLPDTLVFRKL